MVSNGPHQELVPIRTKTGTPASLSTTVEQSTTSRPDSPKPDGGHPLTTQTPKRAKAKTPRQPADDQIPPAMKRWRPALTILSVLMVVVGAFYIALNLGLGRQLYAGTILLGIGLGFAVASQLRSTYAWADRDSSPIVEHADQAPPAKTPKQRTRRRDRTAAPAIPSVKPAPALGVEFRYIVTYGRWLAVEHANVFTEMATFWDTIDWESDESDCDFRDVVEFLYDIAREMPGWDETATQDQMLAGTVARDNGFAFLAEAEAYHPLIGAVAALMLTLKDDRVTGDDFDVVMEPWRNLGFPYRLNDVVFSLDQANEYQAKEVEPRRPAPAGPGSAPAVVNVASPAAQPIGDFDAAVAAHAAVAAPPPPAPAPPAQPVPAETATADKHIEADRDDVPDPDSDLLVLAAELMITSNLGSTAMLQRKLRIGFSLAAKVMHRLYHHGIVGPIPADGGHREVMVKPEELEETLDFIREQEAERRNR